MARKTGSGSLCVSVPDFVSVTSCLLLPLSVSVPATLCLSLPPPLPTCPESPPAAPAAWHAEHWGRRLLRGVSAARGARSPRCCEKRPRCRPLHRRRLGSPRGKEPPRSPRGAPAASNPISASEIIAWATNARLFQPFRGAAAAAGGPRGLGSQRLPRPKPTGGAHLASEEEAGNGRHPEAQGEPRESLREPRRDASRIRLRRVG